jgi:hypothetical protein
VARTTNPTACGHIFVLMLSLYGSAWGARSTIPNATAAQGRPSRNASACVVLPPSRKHSMRRQGRRERARCIRVSTGQRADDSPRLTLSVLLCAEGSSQNRNRPSPGIMQVQSASSLKLPSGGPSCGVRSRKGRTPASSRRLRQPSWMDSSGRTSWRACCRSYSISRCRQPSPSRD